MADDNDLIPKSEAAKILHCSTRTIENHVNNTPGFPRAVKIGRTMQSRVYFYRSELLNWIKAQQGVRPTR